MWFGKGPKNAKRSRTVRRMEVNLGPVLRYSREKVEFSEPERGADAPILDVKPAQVKTLPKPQKAKGK
jgi:hypothetical protein